jgi:hypothetical protein
MGMVKMRATAKTIATVEAMVKPTAMAMVTATVTAMAAATMVATEMVTVIVMATVMASATAIVMATKDPNCIQITAGGNLIKYPGKLLTRTANLTTSKLMWNSVLSTKDV